MIATATAVAAVTATTAFSQIDLYGRHIVTIIYDGSDGSDVSRDPRTGDVLAEIVVNSKEGKVPVLAAYSSPWPLGK